VTPEHNFGDIGVVINIHFNDRDSLEGVGFIEAKIRNKAKGNYASFEAPQVDRIHSNAPHSFLLLYDFAPAQIECRNIDVPFRSFCKVCYSDLYEGTHAIVVPMNIVLTKEKLNQQIYRFALPLSYQLCFRYILGFDLNFARHPLKSAMEFAMSRPTRYIMVITVIHGDRQIERTLFPNDNLYERFEDQGDEGAA
jgi:hypothetical protein